MKKLLTTLFAISSLFVFAQTPQGINYQSIIRTTGGIVIPNTVVNMEFKLYNGLAGALVYHESHAPTTNSFGLANLIIGQGSPISGTFNTITWSNGIAYEVYVNSTLIGTKQLFMSVPYALNAGSAPAPTVTFTNNILSVGGNTTTIPAGITYTAGDGIDIIGSVISGTANIIGTGATSITGIYPNLTINTPTVQSYSAGSGINIDGAGVITNIAPPATPYTLTTISNSITIDNGTASSTATVPAFSAGNGINIDGAGVITNIAPPATPYTLTTISNSITIDNGTASSTATVPAFSAGNGINIDAAGVITNTASSTNLPAAFNGQFLYYNDVVAKWDTIPQDRLFYDETNNMFGIGTKTPSSDLHVNGAGRFNSSVTTSQIYTNDIQIATGTFTNAGDVLTNDGAGNGIWQTPITPTVTGTGIAAVTPTTGNVFNVDVPVPVLGYNNGTNVLSLTQGTTVTTATLVGTGTNTTSIVGSGLATVTPTTGSTFTVSVSSPTFTSNGPTTISGAYPNYTVNSVATPSTTLIQGSNISLNQTGNTYTVSASAYSLTSNSNTLTLSNGSSITTATVPAAVTPTINGFGTGIATVTTSASNFTVNVPTQTLTVTSNSVITSNLGGSATITPAVLSYTSGTNTLKLTDGLSVNTITLNTTAATTLTQGANVTVSGASPSYTIASITPTLSVVGGALSGSYPTQTLTIPTSSTTVLTQSIGILVTGTAPNYTLSSPNQSLSITGNSLAITGANTVIVPTSTVVAGNANITVTPSGNTYSVSSITPTLSVVGGILSGAYPTQTLTVPTSSTTNISQGTNVTVLGTAPSYTVSSVTPTLNVVGGTLTGAYPAQTLTIPTSSTTILTQSTGITLTGTAPNYTLSSPNQSLSITGNSLSITGGNTVTIPPTTINGTGTGIASVTTSVNNFTVNVQSPTYTATNGVLSFGGTNTVVVSPTLSLTGSTLTSGASTNSVNLSSLSVWSNSVGVLYPTILTNSVGVGTSGPLTDKMEIKHASSPTNTHLHLKQIGADSSSRIKFSNAVAPAKFWLNEIRSATDDMYSGYNFHYYNGTIGKNLFTVVGSGKVSVNIASLPYPTLLEVNGGFELDSTIAVNGLNAMPPPSLLNSGKIYFDRANQRFKVSQNGGAYVDLLGGGAPSPWIQSPGKVTLNNINDSVGIGTATPASKLHVYGMADPLEIAVENTGGAFKTGYKIKTASQEWFIGKETGFSNGLSFSDITKGRVSMVIETSGNVGIGTTLPNEKLDVSGNVKLDSSLIVQGLNLMPSTSFAGSGRIYFDQASGKFKVSENGLPYVDMIGGGSPAPWIQGLGNVFLNNIGDKVGIGTNAPAYKLDITETFSNNGGAAVNILTSSSSTVGANSGIYSDLLGSSSGNYISGYFRSEALAGATGSPLGVKGLSVGNNLTSATGVSGSAMNGNQNTGVYGSASGAAGTTNYGVFGEVAGPGYAGYFTGGPTLVDGKFVLWPQVAAPTAFMGQGSFYYDNTSNKIMVAENSTTYKPLFTNQPWVQGVGTVTLTNMTDNVGIGTTAPMQKLHITDITNGAKQRFEGPVAGAAAINSAIEFFETTTFKASMGWASQASQQYWFVYDGATAQNMVYKAGNLGIGTQVPDGRLDVRGGLFIQNTATTNSDDIVIKRPGALSATNVRFVLSERSTNQNLMLFGHDGTTYKNFMEFDYPNNKVVFPAAGNNLVIDNANLRVGIGASAPSAKLDVAGTIAITGGVTSELNRTSTGAANMVPICYGNINPTGTINAAGSTPNFTVIWDATNLWYEITITGETFNNTSYVTMVTRIGGPTGTTTATSALSPKLVVVFNDAGGLKIQNQFQFLVFKP